MVNGDVKKATKIYLLKQNYKTAIDTNPQLEKVLTELQLSEEEAIQIFSEYPAAKSIVLSDSDKKRKDLNTFCMRYSIDRQIMYETYRISYIYQKNLTDALNLIKTKKWSKKQRLASSLLCEKYGNGIEEYIIMQSLEGRETIERELKQNICSLEEAIAKTIIEENKSNLAPSYLEEIFYLIAIKIKAQEYISYEELEKLIEKHVQYYLLTGEEKEKTKTSLDRYLEYLYQYQLCDLACTKNEDRRAKKIKQYDFTDDDIIEAFFIREKLDKNSIFQKTSLSEKRRNALIYLVASWQWLKEDEKRKKTETLKEEEQYVLEILLTKIDDFTRSCDKSRLR